MKNLKALKKKYLKKSLLIESNFTKDREKILQGKDNPVIRVKKLTKLSFVASKARSKLMADWRKEFKGKLPKYGWWGVDNE